MRYEVDCGGRTDYGNLSEALRAAEKRCDLSPEIHLHAGIYREKIVVTLPNVEIFGDGQADTRLVFGDSAHQLDEQGNALGTFRTATLRLHADGARLRDLTIENDAGPGEIVEQAVALYIAGDRCEVRNCTLEAHQDTLFIGPDWGLINEVEPCGRRAYLDKCLIRGNVDFIFGSYAAWFELCTLWCISRGETVNAMIAAPNTPEGQMFGFVFHACDVAGDCEPGTVYLGRPWRPFGRAAFIHCHFPICVAPIGWLDWEKPYRPVWRGLCETASEMTLLRHPRAGVLTDVMLADYTIENVLARDGWLPRR